MARTSALAAVSLAAVSLGIASPAWGQMVIAVGSSSDFFNAVQTINTNPSTNYTLNLTSNITMSQQVLAIETGANVTVLGNGHTIDGAGAFRPFFIDSGTVALQNLTVSNAMAQGGAGGAGLIGGGGGMGAGAAVFVNNGAHLSLQDVSFANNASHGGAGGSFTNNSNDFAGGGGGMGGNGGASNLASGGGGGLYGAGGSGGGTGGGYGGGGGGGGQIGAGGAGHSDNNDGGGGGGGGKTAAGGNGTLSAGGAGGGAQGGAGGFDATSGVNGSTSGGGGGGGLFGGSGAHGGQFAGGGGAGYWWNSNPPNGGNGGFAGGGGASYGLSGNGGFGGGGGGNSFTVAGNGGFGGGGGSANGGGIAGNGGFGGGNGGGSSNYVGTGGGGGAGFGGAVFVVAGGTITVVNNASFSANTATAGTGGTGDVGSGGSGTNGGNGAADGNDLFLMRGVTTTFNITASNSLTFSPTIGNDDGTGNAGVSIDKVGAGTLVLTGNSPLLGSTTVDAGTLVANGNLGGTMTVNSGGTLMGDGVVGSTTINAGGTIYPATVGTSLGINGSFTQMSGSTFAAEINPTQNNRINVNGAALINSGTTLRIIVDPGTYTVGTTYTLLTAAGGLSGQYSFLTAPGSGLGFSVIYDPNDIELLITSIGTNFANYAQTANQLAVAQTLDATSGTATGDYAMVIAQLQTLSSSQLPGAFNQLAGDIYPSLGAIELQTTTAWMQLLNNRLVQQLRPVAIDGATEAVYAPAERYDAEVRLVSYRDSDGKTRQTPRLVVRRTTYTPRWSGWTQGYGLGGNVASNGNAGGLNYGLGGTLVGMDRWLDDNTLFGCFGGYAATSLRDNLNGDHAGITSGQFGVYELYRSGQLYVSNVDAFSGSSYNVTRPIDFGTIARTANGKSSGNQFAHYTEAGATLGSGGVRLQPFTGLQYIYLDQHGFNETGADSIDLTTSHQYINSVRGNLGGRIYSDTTWRGLRVIPSLSARYQHEWGNGTNLISSSFSGAPTTSFVTAGNNLGRDFGLFTLSATALLSERASLFAAADSQVSSSYYAVMGSGGFQYRW